HDAGRKVSKDQLAAAQVRAQLAVEHLQTQQHQALGLLQQWQLANDLPLANSPGNAVYASDPWDALQKCTAEGAEFLDKIKTLKLPGYVRGARPFLVIGLVWLLASLPALLLTDLNVVYWLVVTTATVIP